MPASAASDPPPASPQACCVQVRAAAGWGPTAASAASPAAPRLATWECWARRPGQDYVVGGALAAARHRPPRLRGVGAASSEHTYSATPGPAQDGWRRQLSEGMWPGRQGRGPAGVEEGGSYAVPRECQKCHARHACFAMHAIRQKADEVGFRAIPRCQELKGGGQCNSMRWGRRSTCAHLISVAVCARLLASNSSTLGVGGCLGGCLLSKAVGGDGANLGTDT
jgi:hypothetical protein